ncbi:MAG: response regulator [Deltaproteobacteria bacterium]|nr:response regulator [Deltaproteobacteria bacterium]MBW2002691.1 response regulator [Deltaproteobacteria bacterium]
MKELAKRKSKETTILVIVYEYIIRDILARILRGKGYTIVTSSVGFDGIRKFKKGKGKFDLVILDIPLPGTGSLSVAKKIKKISQRTPIMLIKGWDRKLDSKKIKDAGFNLVLSTPLYIDNTVNLVNDLVVSAR